MFPHLFVASTVAQVVVTSLVLIDAAIRSRRRWQERWLDYRSIAERLRSLRFLHPLGLAPPELPAAIRQARESWVDWYVRRRARGLGAPTGLMDHAEITSAARRLAEIEIPEQVNYHRNTFRQLGVLDRRLSIAGNVALGLAIAVAAMLGIWAYVGGGMATVGWKSIGIALLFVLPAVMMACNGIRANADLVRLVERSAMAAVILTRLRSAICSSAPTYDRVAVGAMRAASVMADELSEWRFVLESRRVRRKGFHMLRRPRFRR